MKTIHDEEKIKEILTAGTEQAGDFHHSANVIPTHVAEMLIKQYAEHIRLKTIDEAIGCINKMIKENTKGCPFPTEQESVAREIITNLEQLKK